MQSKLFPMQNAMVTLPLMVADFVLQKHILHKGRYLYEHKVYPHFKMESRREKLS